MTESMGESGGEQPHESSELPIERYAVASFVREYSTNPDVFFRNELAAMYNGNGILTARLANLAEENELPLPQEIVFMNGAAVVHNLLGRSVSTIPEINQEQFLSALASVGSRVGEGQTLSGFARIAVNQIVNNNNIFERMLTQTNIGEQLKDPDFCLGFLLTYESFRNAPAPQWQSRENASSTEQAQSVSPFPVSEDAVAQVDHALGSNDEGYMFAYNNTLRVINRENGQLLEFIGRMFIERGGNPASAFDVHEGIIAAYRLIRASVGDQEMPVVTQESFNEFIRKTISENPSRDVFEDVDSLRSRDPHFAKAIDQYAGMRLRGRDAFYEGVIATYLTLEAAWEERSLLELLDFEPKIGESDK